MSGDDELYSSFLAGNTADYDLLMLRYGDGLLGYLNGYLHSREDAEDLMIEAFARIMAKRPRIGAGNFKAYLYRTAHNLMAHFCRKNSRMQVFSLEEADGLGGGTVPEDAFAAEEKRRILHLCMERIGPQLKEALWLVYFEDLSYAQAAEVMGVRVKKVDNLLIRAKARLKEELRTEGVTDAYI